MLGTTLRILKELPRPVRLLILGTFVNKAGTFIVPFLAIVLRRDFGFSAGRIGRVLFAYGAGSFVSIVAGGWLTDRLGRRFTLHLSLVAAGMLAVALGVAGSTAAFVPLLIGLGFVSDLYRPASSAIISDLL